MKRLLDAGTDVFRGDLHHAAACRECSPDVTLIINLLVEQGVPLDTYEFDNPVARPLRYGYKSAALLHVACEKRNYYAAQAFLMHGADPHCLMRKGEQLVPPTPLEIALGDSVLTQIFRKYIEPAQCC